VYVENLCREGLLSADQRQVAERESFLKNISLEQALLELGFISEQVLVEFKASLGDVEEINLSKTVLDTALLKQFPKALAIQHQILPIALKDGALEIAMSDPFNIVGMDVLRRHLSTSLPFLKRLAPLSHVLEAIDLHYGPSETFKELLQEMDAATSDTKDSPVIRMVNMFLWDAVGKKASDIHLEPQGRFVRVRYRLDGDLQNVLTFHKVYWPALIIRFKVMAGLNIAEGRRPQGGSFTFYVRGRDVDFRLSTHPVVEGESLVVRILDKSYSLRRLEDLGLTREVADFLVSSAEKSHGMVVVTGPTGSGKTTTLYSLLAQIQKPTLNIMTLEQPVEYKMSGIRQTEIQEEAGITFAQGIRSILRHDPDVILVGEIRDPDTAMMAVRASITGHQVLTTLHTQDVFGVLARLKDLGILLPMLEGHLSLIFSQRLLKQLCEACKKPRAPLAWERQLVLQKGVSDFDVLYEKQGCPACSHKGYQGRFAIGEALHIATMLPPSFADLRVEDLREYALKKGLKTLGVRAFEAVKAGRTSLDQALLSEAFEP